MLFTKGATRASRVGRIGGIAAGLLWLPIAGLLGLSGLVWIGFVPILGLVYAVPAFGLFILGGALIMDRGGARPVLISLLLGGLILAGALVEVLSVGMDGSGAPIAMAYGAAIVISSALRVASGVLGDG
jgi:hypothetical protein